jgi:hypothetical protein
VDVSQFRWIILHVGNPQAPDWQCGGVEVVYYTVSDAKGCNVTTVSATFTVTPPPAIVYNAPENYIASICEFPVQVVKINGWYPYEAAFADWLDEFVYVSGNCETPTLSLDVIANFGPCSGNATATFTLTGRCETIVVTRTFTITPADELFAEKDDYEASACEFESQTELDDFFAIWIDDIYIAGGCSPTFTYDIELEAPNLCLGGTVTVVYQVFDQVHGW